MRHVVTLLILLLTGTTALASDPQTRLQMAKAELTDKISGLVHELDPGAQVIVKTKVAKKNLTLPGTPFSLNANVPTGSTERFSEIDVTVLTSSGTLPASVEALIKVLASDYTEKISVQAKALPKEMLAARADRAATTDRKSWESPLTSVLTGLAPIVKTLESPTSRLTTIGFIASGVLVLLVCATLFLWNKSQTQMLAALDRGFAQLATAYEAGGGAQTPTARDIEASRRDAAPVLLPSSGKDLSTLSDSCLLALLADCYWTHEDGYAAFIWRRITAVKKLAALTAMPELAEYGTYLQQVAERDLGLEHDPSYLQPLPLARLDTQALTDLVRKTPGLINLLSPLRMASLNLRPSERLTLIKTEANHQPNLSPGIESLRSEPRVLTRPLGIQIRSVEDEAEILALDAPSLALITEVPSLGWLLKLERDDVQAILQGVSAKDLATAWIGPQPVLDELASLVGDKKLTMMQSHLERLRPSRTAPAFFAIHRRVVQALRDAQEVPQDTTNVAA